MKRLFFALVMFSATSAAGAASRSHLLSVVSEDPLKYNHPTTIAVTATTTEREVITSSPSQTLATTTTTTTTTTLSSEKNGSRIRSAKLANVRQRAIPAVALLIGLYFLARTFQEKGLTVLLLLLSPGLYYEATSVLDSHNTHPVGLDIFTNRWWWFVAYSLAATIPRTLRQFDPSPYLPHVCHLASYGLVVVGFMAWILRLNTENVAAASLHFLKAWHEMAVYHMGIVFTVIPIAFWMAVLSDYGMSWALYTALTVVLNDTLAYAFGFTLGKSALLPTISPKKTWEGFTGAFLATVVLSRPLWNRLFANQSYNKHSLVIALFCCVAAPFGGFMASSIKRAGNKKDFGDCIAGHGGLVDRLDCQLVAAPFLYLYLKAAQI